MQFKLNLFYNVKKRGLICFLVIFLPKKLTKNKKKIKKKTCKNQLLCLFLRRLKSEIYEKKFVN